MALELPLCGGALGWTPKWEPLQAGTRGHCQGGIPPQELAVQGLEGRAGQYRRAARGAALCNDGGQLLQPGEAVGVGEGGARRHFLCGREAEVLG